MFTCEATIVSFIKGKPWYYTTCTECRRKMYKTNEGWLCGSHENLPEPKFMYCASTTIVDHTDSTTATLFDEALTSIVGQPCRDIVIQEGYTDHYQVPKPLLEAVGRLISMHVRYLKSPMPGSSILAVNRASITQPLVVTQGTPPSLTQTTPNGQKELRSNQSATSTTTRKLSFTEPGLFLTTYTTIVLQH
ncbi:putative nucleic acid-binding, replication factor A [Helianthus anomalus]